jgi:pantetheine-phosphate adenylyltransferase
MANMNRAMSSEFETVFLTPKENLSSISSSLIREIAAMNGDVEQFVPAAVFTALNAKFAV